MIRRLAFAACIPTVALLTALSAATPASAGAKPLAGAPAAQSRR